MRKLEPRHLRKISSEEINALPLWRYEGPIELIRTEEELLRAVKHMEKETVLGFDTETRPSFSKGKSYPPALVQIACHDVVFLVQLTWLPFGETLAGLLGNGNIIKTGVAIRDDIRELQRSYDFRDAGVVDLGEIARDNGRETHGLRNLAANFLSLRISKAVRCSNWSHKELGRQQMVYAATDAWISRELHLCMSELGLISHKPS